jgi:hypothetical protein
VENVQENNIGNFAQGQAAYGEQLGLLSNGAGGGYNYTGNGDLSAAGDNYGFGGGTNWGFQSDTVDPYDPFINAAAGQAQTYDSFAQQAAKQAGNVPQINNTFAGQTSHNLAGVNNGQNALMQGLANQANNGKISQAYQQYQNGVQQGLTAQNAVANSTNGGMNASSARRGAMEQNGMTSANSAAGGALVADQAAASARQQEGALLGEQGNLQNSLYSQNQNQAYAQAQLASQQGGLANAGVLGYNSLASNEQGQQLNAIQGAANQLGETEGLGTANQAMNFQNTMQGVSTVAGAGSGLASIASGIAGSNQQAQQNAQAQQQAQPADNAGENSTGGGSGMNAYGV